MELSNDDNIKLKGKSGVVRIMVSIMTKGINQLINGECDESESGLMGLAEYAKNFICPEKVMSKYESAKYLGISSKTFDRYIETRKIPKGKSQAGFKELSWLKKDLDKFKRELANESSRKLK